MTIIVMTREMGTLGKEVAREFSRHKDISVVHHELIHGPRDRMAQTEESEVFRFLEGNEEEMSKWRNNRTQDGYLTPEEIYEIALEGNVLIRGWGAARLLKAIPNVLSVRVCAPMAFRVAQMVDRLGLGEREARREIERSDAAHSRTFMRFFATDWRDPLNYDLVLNTAHLSPGTCAEILLDAAANPAFSESRETRQALLDAMLQARIEAALKSDSSLGRQGQHIQVSVENAGVRLYGVVSDGQSRQGAERIVAAQAGVQAVQNEIARINRFSN